MLLPADGERGDGEKALIDDTIYDEASEPSSDILQPTQVPRLHVTVCLFCNILPNTIN